jgi:hypothetical protein
MGVTVGSLAHGEHRVDALVAAHRARSRPGAARVVLGPAPHRFLPRSVGAEPAVPAAYEPVAVHCADH